MTDSERDRLYKMTGGPAFGHGNPNDGGGSGDLSCCDGPAGVATELPTDPNASSGST
jgi:hypothetical protein